MCHRRIKTVHYPRGTLLCMWRTRSQSDAGKEDQPTRHPKDESDLMSHPSVICLLKCKQHSTEGLLRGITSHRGFIKE